MAGSSFHTEAYSEQDEMHLKTWCQSLRLTTHVDFVGDFVGKELVAIHGEALLSYCLRSAAIDYKDGFQLLHAVHAVESVLAKLRDRGCNFHITWFDDEVDHSSIDDGALNSGLEKYQLTRAILTKHFSNLPPTSSGISSGSSFRFSSAASHEFEQYLEMHPLQVFLCLLRRPRSGYTLSSKGYFVGDLDSLEFVSSKVYVSVASSDTKLPSLESHASKAEQTNLPTDIGIRLKQVLEVTAIHSLTAREAITLDAMAQALKHMPQDEPLAQDTRTQMLAMLAQLCLLRSLHLSERSHSDIKAPDETVDRFLSWLFHSARDLIYQWPENSTGPSWDLYDMFDGRLYLACLELIASANMTRMAERYFRERTLCFRAALKDLTGLEITFDETRVGSNARSNTLGLRKKDESEIAVGLSEEKSELQGPSDTSGVLPFAHPTLDKYLGVVGVKTTRNEPPESDSRIFHELTHWHNSKKLLDPKLLPKAPDLRAARKNQKFMSSIIAYSASLASSSGKDIQPEIIVVQEPINSTAASSSSVSQKALSTAPPSGSGKAQTRKGKQPANKQHVQKSGKERALEAAAAIVAGKKTKRAAAVDTLWSQRAVEFEREESLVLRYQKARRFLQGLSDDTRDAIGSEVSLYLCNTLALMRTGTQKVSYKHADLLALVFKHAREVRAGGLTQSIATQLEVIEKALKIESAITLSSTLTKRALKFNSRLVQNLRGYETGMSATEFQLQYCGPYLERNFDSAPDPRVPFSPDAWQRKVLDTIDAGNSLFVIAPTSAGKTFISFYAMRKILQSSNDDILVYVAPTKALVNQIAAEVQARFSKSYHSETQAGKCVWAIHTRDYRVNSTTKCQILVTVPHILQIMLLAPSNAKGPNSWARRVKSIIFDEVHCIGQSEEGVVWEQLLLLAPCPIIALSATVGNPESFHNWLQTVEASKGHQLETVIHGSRYSDLRKFLHIPRDVGNFEGLAKLDLLPIPDIDAHHGAASRLTYLHPVGMLKGRNADLLNDLSLEPRDCYNLWRSMCTHQNEIFPVSDDLNPHKWFTNICNKPSVMQWEARLKEQLKSWMVDRGSPFEAVYSDLTPTPSSFTFKQEGSEQSRKGGGHFSLALDLHTTGGLPAIFFHYDRDGCEDILMELYNTLSLSEARHKDNNPAWTKKLADFERWKRTTEKMKPSKPRPQNRDAEDEGSGKLDMAREQGEKDISPWASFDPEAPLLEFSFADTTKITREELDQHVKTLSHPWLGIGKHFIHALTRGIAVHHAGMNRQYRQIVEMLFRKRFLTIVVATGTLAVGLNMPCKTAAFCGDSIFLSALNYRQASGRAGRRGFDLLGNVVFHGIGEDRVREIMSSKLPAVQGQFPTSVTLILRLFTLLYGTDNSEYAVNAMESLMSQTQLYLGGPAAQMSIAHHLRFSIEYLRRQSLLSATGEPLNFSGLISHLYFTENAAFSFHSLLKSGFFHKLCAGIGQPSQQQVILRELVLVLSHLFSLIPIPRHRLMDEEWRQKVHKSPSLVILPNLPDDAARLLRGHNAETLEIFRNYVMTYVQQHLADAPDVTLPFTKHLLSQTAAARGAVTTLPGLLPPTKIRSPFSALSGGTDDFATIGELCATVRDGVFLEESAIPYIRIHPDETDGSPWNAYLYDFFKHGDLVALTRDNNIKRGDVWFRLKDFSLVLAAIEVSLAGYFGGGGSVGTDDDAGVPEFQDAAVRMDDEAEVAVLNDPAVKLPTAASQATGAVQNDPRHEKTERKKAKDMDSWDDDLSDDCSSASCKGSSSSSGDAADVGDGSESLANVWRAFSMLRQEFDEKFRKIGA